MHFHPELCLKVPVLSIGSDIRPSKVQERTTAISTNRAPAPQDQQRKTDVTTAPVPFLRPAIDTLQRKSIPTQRAEATKP